MQSKNTYRERMKALNSRMNKSFVCLFACLCFALPAYALSGWVGATGLVSTENVYPQQGLELGVQDQYSLTENLELRGSASVQGQRNPEVNYALADYTLLSTDTAVAGVRAGRLQLPYGFGNDLRVHPATRQGIIPKPSIVWPQNKALYDQGDGTVAYLNHYFFGLWSFAGEWGHIARSNPQPQKNYVQDLVGVKSKQVETSFQHIALSYAQWVFRADEMQPTQTFSISDKHWSDQIKIIPQAFWITGDYTVDYRLSYRGIKYWGNKHTLTFDRAVFKYTGGGSISEYYNAIRRAVPNHERYYYNLGAEYFHTDALTLYVDFGRTYSKRDSKNIGENIIGAKFTDGATTYKVQAIYSMTNRWSEWEYNGSWERVTTPFNLYAISIIHEL